MTIKAHEYLLEIKNYKPGKAKVVGKNQVVKLSSNENALGASSKAIKAYQDHAQDISRYADGSCEALREALAKKNNIDAQNIVCGAGSDEILALITTAFASVGDEVIYSKHGFLMYPISAKRVGAKPVVVEEKNFKIDVDDLQKKLSKKTKIIFIANPNNPTGAYLNEKEILEIINLVGSEVLIVLDHAYDEFVEAKDYPNAIALAKKYPNIVVTRTFSKIYGLASLRLGWSFSSQEIAEVLNKVRGPFNVGGAPQFAGVAALNDEEFLQKSKAHNSKWLKIFFAEFAKMDRSNSLQIKAHPSVANFILLEFKDETTAQKVNESLLANGIILREMSSYHLPNCLRMTIGTDVENEALLKIIKEFR